MAKFKCESRVKWRSTSSSPSSGKPGISSRRSTPGIRSVILVSSSGQKKPLLPGEPLSKISGGADRKRLVPGECSDKLFDLLFLVRLSHADKQAILKLGIPTDQRNAWDDLLSGEMRESPLQSVHAKNKLIEKSTGEDGD